MPTPTLPTEMTTTVRNVSGVAKSFACLPRSKRLLPGQEHTFTGDLATALLTGGRPNKRKANGLQRALDLGMLAVVNTPGPLCFDEALDATKVVKVANGAVVAADPSWGRYSSSVGG